MMNDWSNPLAFGSSESLVLDYVWPGSRIKLKLFSV